MNTPSARDVVVTGLGAFTPLGTDVSTTWDALLQGRSGARTLTQDWVAQYDLPVTFAASVVANTEDLMPRIETRRNDPVGQYALIASREAWQHCGAPEVDPERLGVVIASGIGGVTTLLDSYDTLKEKGPRRIFPLTVPMMMPNGPAAAVELELGARAGTHTPVSACASGAESMAYALDMIRSGRADIVVAGGTEACVHPLPIGGFAAMSALSTRNDDPALASRPYDTGRDGFVLGEGAAVMVLESAEHAAARGATVYARLSGAGLTSDAYHLAAPDPDGLGASRAMLAALKDADADVMDVHHLNAHATSTPAGDIAEAASIAATLKDATDQVIVSATKSMTGHLLGAAGALESVFTVLALHHRTAPPTINLDSLDPEVTIRVSTPQPEKLPEGDLVAINNSFGFGGHNVALAFRSVS